ncbi:DsbA family protein [Phenylobacterium immobile]|uniref:DsbA family protein n=1 Tax=Phenylobacterium immobile TaxID=21 RepID=UPI000AACECEA|nr:DsbA family protein [Phenylobacterium immobile]
MSPLILLAGATAALSLAGCQPSQDAAFGEKVRAYLMAHPEVIREAVQKLSEKERMAEAQQSGELIEKHRTALERDPRDFVANPDGKITVVEFFDYRCGFCKTAAPEIIALIAENPDVRFVFKEFPIFGEVSDTAARVSLTPQVKAKGLEVYKAMMADKALNEAAIDRHLAAAGLDPVKIRADAKAPSIVKQIAEVRALAMAMKIEGTPAFIVGDTFIGGADIPSLKAAIAVAKADAARKT